MQKPVTNNINENKISNIISKKGISHKKIGKSGI
jgi:hypothetical protein